MAPPITATFSLLFLFIISSTTALSLRDTEVKALTAFKLALNDPLGHLDGWDPSTSSAPCDWNGVVCSDGRVRELRLPRLQLGGQLTDSLAELRELRKLSLHSNNLGGSIPLSLSQCTLLRAVYLNDNSLSGRLPPFLLGLSNLQVLNLARNSLSGQISPPGGTISPSLRYLDVSSNGFSGDIPAGFSASSQFQLLNFSFNSFSGEVPAAIGDLQRLEYLWLDSNRLYGTLPSAISNCSSLVHLSADDNDLRGLIPATIGALPRLQVLSLSRNGFSGPVPVSLLCGSSSLRIVEIGFNAVTRMVKPPNGEKCTSVLEVLSLKENHIHGVFPHWLTNVTALTSLDLSGNFFSGSLPVQVGNLLRLEELRLANNSFAGKIPVEIEQCSSLKVFDLGSNRFSGQIPQQLGNLRSLKILSLGQNSLSGSVPASLGSLSDLEILNLGGNILTGKVPGELLELTNLTTLNLSENKLFGDVLSNIGELRNLKVLNLSKCGFSGTFPSRSIGNLMKLSTLDLSKQRLSGHLPIELFGLPSLKVVALQENLLSGDVPEGFSSLASLQYLNLSENQFSGDIPITFGFLRSLNVLSLSSNKISGEIPPEIGNCSALERLELRSNRLTGIIPGEISRLSRLERLDLGRNNLVGEIPEEISECSSLTSILLDSNQLSGNIPISLPKLSNLTELNLSTNNLIGVIPENLALIQSLTSLNLSRNNLDGEIPRRLGDRFGYTSAFERNPRLCGEPLDKECPSERRRKRRKLMLFVGIASGGAFLLFLCCCGYLYSLLRWRKRLREGVSGGIKKRRSPVRGSSGDRSRGSSESNGGPKLVMFNAKITYAEALEATRQFDEENVLSRGRYGLVFKATFQDGTVLSIRRLTESNLDEATFRREAEALGKVRHRNLTVLRGYYYSATSDVRLLVYDYMPNGTLATLLQEASNHQDGGHVLNWPMRHLIALGVARGLSSLHSLPLLHGHVAPTAILFDADFEPHLSDFGLHRLTSAVAAEASSSAAVVGYAAPEEAVEATREGDVYSFGIVLLEILTGKKPVMFDGDEDIVKWVKKQLQTGQVSELLDPGLLELDPESSEWEEFLLGVKVGLLCTAPDPVDRPSMSDIVFMLEGCRVGPEFPSSADPTSVPSPA